MNDRIPAFNATLVDPFGVDQKGSWTHQAIQFTFQDITLDLRFQIEKFIDEVKYHCFDCNDIDKDKATALAYSYSFLDQIHMYLNAN